MTAIAGWIDKKTKEVWIGGDSSANDEHTIFIQKKGAKVFKVGEFLIGGAGSFRMLQLLRFGGIDEDLHLKRLDIPKNNLLKFMVVDFVPLIRALFKEGGITEFESEAEQFPGSFLVGLRGNLFSVDSDFQVGEYDSFLSVGSGYHLCMGAMKVAWEAGYSPKEGILSALEAAAKYSNSVQGPFAILRS